MDRSIRGAKRVISAIMGMVIAITGLPLFALADSPPPPADSPLEIVSGRLPYMDEVLAKYPKLDGQDSLVLAGRDGSPSNGERRLADGLYGQEQPYLIFDREAEEVTWTFNLSSPGRYIFSIKYGILSDGSNNAVFNILVDGQTPFFESNNIVFYRMWEETGDIAHNSLGDELRPDITEKQGWQTSPLRDGSGFYATPLVFWLEAGEHSLTLQYVSQDMAIGELYIEPYISLPDYEQVSEQYSEDCRQGAESITVQAEKVAVIRNDATIRMESDGDPSATPIAYGYRVFNAIGGSRWKKGNQEITFSFDVQHTGYYKIALRFKQTWNDGVPSYRSIKLDGEIPFAELESVSFPYMSDWQTMTLGSETEPFLFYLEQGTHTLTMSVVMGDMTQVIHGLYDDMLLASDILQSITKLTGTDPDPNYDYEFFKYIPELENQLRTLIANLNEDIRLIGSVSKKNTAMASNLQSIAKQLESMLQNPFSIAKRYNQLVQAQSSIGTWYLDIQNQPLLLDEISVAQAQAVIPVRRSTWFQKLKSLGKNFLLSFVKDYDSVAGTVSGDVVIREVVDVWVARGTEWAEVIKEMADQSFTPQTGILVNLNVVPSSQLNSGSANALLLSITSGTNPNVAMGVAASSPVEFAIRDTVVNLKDYPDFDEVRQRFLQDILIPFEYQGGIYALPETMNFTCLFYRKDILDKYGIPIPDTREELYNKTLPALYQNGMEYYQPQDFTQFLFQHGGSFYTEDGQHSALDSAQALAAFQEYTEMFTHYGLPINASFFNRFRTGETPIGVGNYGLYLQLSTAAPELIGKWGIHSLPGVCEKDGEVNRSFGGLAAESDMILRGANKNKLEASWTFLKWWSSTEVQRQYAREIEALMGVEARWNTANLTAFESLEWSPSDLSVLQEQFKWATETPIVLGGYYTSRYITNAFTNVVVSGTHSARDAMEEAVKEINRELAMKQREYGVSANE